MVSYEATQRPGSAAMSKVPRSWAHTGLNRFQVQITSQANSFTLQPAQGLARELRHINEQLNYPSPLGLTTTTPWLLTTLSLHQKGSLKRISPGVKTGLRQFLCSQHRIHDRNVPGGGTCPGHKGHESQEGEDVEVSGLTFYAD